MNRNTMRLSMLIISRKFRLKLSKSFFFFFGGANHPIHGFIVYLLLSYSPELESNQRPPIHKVQIGLLPLSYPDKSRLPDLDRRHAAYKAAALPTELRRHGARFDLAVEERPGKPSFPYTEGEGFEPPDACASLRFKRSAFDLSASLPYRP